MSEKIDIFEVALSHRLPGEDFLIVTYETEAMFEAQKAWMEERLDAWLYAFEKKFSQLYFSKISYKYLQNRKISIVLKFKIPFTVLFDELLEPKAQSPVIGQFKKTWAKAIIKHHPLPFDVSSFDHIPIHPEYSLKYLICSNGHYLHKKYVPRVSSKEFRSDIAYQLEHFSSKLCSIRVLPLASSSKFVAYLEFIHDFGEIPAGDIEAMPAFQNVKISLRQMSKGSLQLLPIANDLVC